MLQFSVDCVVRRPISQVDTVVDVNRVASVEISSPAEPGVCPDLPDEASHSPGPAAFFVSGEAFAVTEMTIVNQVHIDRVTDVMVAA